MFQDPVASLNPRDTIGTAVADPLRVAGVGRAERRDRVAWLLDRVGLGQGLADRYPHELSGGQRQRVAIARALAPRPRVVICDEPVSALDVSVRAQVLDLLAELRPSSVSAYLFISHDLAVVRHVADRVAVMHLGRIVESGPTGRVWSRRPSPTPGRCSRPCRGSHLDAGEQRMPLQGDPPSPRRPPSGRRFRTRCLLAFDRCALEDPPPVDLGGRPAGRLRLIAGEALVGRSRPRQRQPHLAADQADAAGARHQLHVSARQRGAGPSGQQGVHARRTAPRRPGRGRPAAAPELDWVLAGLH